MTPSTWESTQGSVDASSLTVQIVDAVADAAGVDPLDLPPLYDTVDPDLLADYVDRCRRLGGPSDRVAFDYADHRVEVTTGGAVEVLSLEPDGDATPGATDSSRMVRYECDGQAQVLVTEPGHDEAWLRSDYAVTIDE